MGRHAGFLTAASCLAKKYPDDGPHLIYLPERAFSKEQFLRDVDKVYKEFGRCIVAASEGIVDENHRAIIEQFTGGEKDSHGNVQLSGTGALGDFLSGWVKNDLQIKRVRSDTFGYLQRSFLGCVSSQDQYEAREVGEKAAQYAIWHNMDGSVAMRRVGDYAVEYFLTPLETVARESTCMPDEFINAEGNYVTDAFRNYVRPLVGSMPLMERISAPSVAKLLKRGENA
jgi:6-phosphofructokinase 1